MPYIVALLTGSVIGCAIGIAICEIKERAALRNKHMTAALEPGFDIPMPPMKGIVK